MPYFNSKSLAGVELLRHVRETLGKAPKTQDMNQIVNIAKPIAKRMTLIKPRFEKELNSIVPWKTSLAILIFSFIGSMTSHFLFLYIYHRFHAVRKLIPEFLKVGEEKVHVKPVLSMTFAIH